MKIDMRSVKYYTQGRVPGDWNSVQNRIERNSEWAIVHDIAEGRWEVWCDGRMYTGTCTDKEEAEAIMEKMINR
ncbi:hypothetical protein [Sphaerisporangium aureirubrum]|uniref:Uncharacterized protein n=1 Tax=Sphaerisporangium aureirubrum TaxID=1544736 RepID=A0ABW1NME9_9ACTN